MKREEMAKKLWFVRHEDAVDDDWDGVLYLYKNELLRMADAALAEIRKAAEEAYREGAIDALMAAQSRSDMSSRAIGVAERAFAELNRYAQSATRAKWEAKS